METVTCLKIQLYANEKNSWKSTKWESQLYQKDKWGRKQLCEDTIWLRVNCTTWSVSRIS